MKNSNHPEDTNGSVARSLRALMPTRKLSFDEALQRAELQALRLLSLHQVSHPAVPIEIITEQPRIRIVESYELPVSGSTHWDGRNWVITVNAAEYHLRQRYTLAHEYKHLLDHPVRHLLDAPDGAAELAEDMVERIADYFAACVLMPRPWVKAAWGQGRQSVELLADEFEVSPKAMSVRLHQLGLTTSVDRCPGPFGNQSQRVAPSRRSWPSRSRRTYHRARSTSWPIRSAHETWPEVVEVVG